MKKILLFVVSVLVAATMFAQGAVKSEIQCLDQNARMERGTRGASDWCEFTPFVATDMNGVSHDIQEYMNQGKYVVIDFFTAWCTYCYQFHQRGVLESLYNTYGQAEAGTGEFVVLMVECQTNNTPAQISGTHTADTYAGASAGDFTNGGTNPIPIIDATQNYAYNLSFFEGYPTIVVICPSGYAYDIYSHGVTTVPAIYNLANSSCPNEASMPMVNILEPNVVRVGQPATFSSYVVSQPDVTYEWTFEGGTPATATTASVDVVWDTEGQHNVSLVVTNANGSATANTDIDVVDCNTGISDFPFVEDFEHGQGCWDFISMNTENEFGVLEYSDGMHGAFFNSYAQASTSNYNQYMISPELHHARDLNLSFKYKKFESAAEKFYVKYSTTDTEITNFTTIGNAITNATTSWKTHTCVIPADAKYFMIHYASNYKYYLVVDDLRIEEEPEPDEDFIESSMANSISIFPNPTTGIVNIDAEGLNKVAVYDVTGRMMMSVANESTIDISNLEAGVYFFSVETENGSAMKKLVKE